MGAPKAPKPTDPNVTASAQTGSNVFSGLANSYLNNGNEITPWGSLDRKVTGWTNVTDPGNPNDPNDDRTYRLPQWTTTQTLSAEQQRLKGLNDQTQFNLAGVAREQSGRLGELLNRPVDLSNNAIEGRLYELMNKRAGGEFQREQQALEQEMANKGIDMGSDAYHRGFSRLGETQNDRKNQFLLTAHQQGVADTLAERNQPLNELIGLSSGTQIQNPTYAGQASGNIATTDRAGITANYDNAMMNRWQAMNQNRQNLLGGLFGGLSSLGGAFLSDERMKKDIKATGEKINGIPVKDFHYKGEPKSAPMRRGMMAQDVEKKVPGAVKSLFGIKMVDYKKATAPRKSA
jgi:hypothetical protein